MGASPVASGEGRHVAVFDHALHAEGGAVNDLGVMDLSPARKSAITFYNQAMATVQTDQTLAYRLLCSAVTVDPEMAIGWFMLGNTCADLKMLPASIAAFRRCLACQHEANPGGMADELFAKALVNLGHRLLSDGMVEEAHQVTHDALALLEANPHLNPDLQGTGRAFAWLNMSLILSIMGNVEKSLVYAQQAFEMSQEPIIETGLAFAYLFAGDYAAGMRHFEARIPYKLASMASWPYPRWDGGKVGTLFVASDQGIGDTLSFARFVIKAAARAGVGRVIFQVQPDLLDFMTDGLDLWKHKISVVPQEAQFPVADAWCPVGGLPTALGMSSEKIQECAQNWTVPQYFSEAPPGWKSPRAKLHIGIAYAGAPGNEIDRWRSIPVARFLDLHQVPGVQLYSLQVGDRVRDLHEAGCAGLIRDMSPWIKDATDTVALIRDLDLVITCESFLGHLCGAMDVECWVPLSKNGGDWRCGRSGEKPLWYDKHRLFRQGEDATWGPVFERIVGELKQRVGDAP